MHGHLIGGTGAVELLACCDLRVAAEGVRLGVPPVRLGLVYSHTGLRRLILKLMRERRVRTFTAAFQRPDDGFERDRCSCSICAAAGPKTLISGRELTGAWGAGRAWPDDWRPDLGARSGLASGAGLAVCFVPLA